MPSSEAGTVPHSSLLSPGTSVIPYAFSFFTKDPYQAVIQAEAAKRMDLRSKRTGGVEEKDMGTQLRTA